MAKILTMNDSICAALRSPRPNSRCEPQCTRDFGERCLLALTHRHAAKAEKSTLRGGLGNVLADLAQPALEGGCIARRLGVDYRSGLPQRLDALGLDLAGFAASKLFLQAVARDVSPIGGL